jgi:hypothetical protein
MKSYTKEQNCLCYLGSITRRLMVKTDLVKNARSFLHLSPPTSTYPLHTHTHTHTHTYTHTHSAYFVVLVFIINI